MSDIVPAETLPPLPPEPPLAPEKPLVLPLIVQRIAQFLVVVLLPVLLILLSVRVVMSEAYLRLEYQRPGFPEDLYGFSLDDRLHYGAYGIRYLVDNRDISYLGDLEIDGQTAFNADELQHMEDVQVVTRNAFYSLFLVGSIWAGSLILILRERTAHQRARRALRWGGFLTVGLIVLASALVLIAWGFFFDSFHGVFFEDGTWQFSRSDTLIRLYPEQFWFDTSIAIGVLSVVGALFAIGISWYLERRAQAH